MTAVGKALGVLAAFDADHPELSLSELARRMRLPLSTAHRIAAELEAWGALERTGRGYAIGLRLVEVGLLAPRAYQRREAVVPFLEDLVAVTQQNAVYAVLDGDAAVFVEHLTGHGAVPLAFPVGGRLPLHATAIGHVMLAFGPHGLLDRIAGGPLQAYTRHTITSGAELRRAVAAVRRSAVAISREGLSQGASSIAAPVYGRGGELVGALSLVIPTTANAAALAPVVRTAAFGASRALESALRRLPTAAHPAKFPNSLE